MSEMWRRKKVIKIKEIYVFDISLGLYYTDVKKYNIVVIV